MFILIYFLTVAVSQYVSNKLIDVSSEQVDSYSFSKKDSFILGGLFFLGIVLQILSSYLPWYWIIVGIYGLITLIAVLVVLQIRKTAILEQREQINQVYEILQKLVDKKGEGIDYNNIPFTLYYKYGQINHIRVNVEPTQFSSDPDKTILPFIPQLNAFLPTFTWNYELHLDQRYIDFIGDDKPPTMVRWPGSWLRHFRFMPMGVSGKGEVGFKPDSVPKDDAGRSQYLDENGNPIPGVLNLPNAPQGMISGATGGGKSVAVQNVILSCMSHNNKVSIGLIDPKNVEFSNYKGMKGVVGVATNTLESVEMLRVARQVMLKRNKEMAKLGIKNINEYTPSKKSGKVYITGREYNEDDEIKVKIDGQEKLMKAAELVEYLRS